MMMEIRNSFYDDYRRRLEALSEDDVAVFNSVADLSGNETVRCEAHVCILCLVGEASCRVGEKIFEVRRGDLFFGHPNLFIEQMRVSFDFQFVGFVMSPAYIETILSMMGGVANKLFVLQDNPVIHIDEAEMDIVVNDFNFLSVKLNTQRLPHHKESIRCLLQSMAYELLDCLEDKLKAMPYNYTSSELIYQRFMDMAVAETPLHREVKYYAGRLCITPKYLSVVCKNISGQTASAIINNMTREHIRRMLRSTGKSIKEIASEAGFSNLSFFGKYVRRELGASPREFRMKMQ